MHKLPGGSSAEVLGLRSGKVQRNRNPQAASHFNTGNGTISSLSLAPINEIALRLIHRSFLRSDNPVSSVLPARFLNGDQNDREDDASERDDEAEAVVKQVSVGELGRHFDGLGLALKLVGGQRHNIGVRLHVVPLGPAQCIAGVCGGLW